MNWISALGALLGFLREVSAGMRERQIRNGGRAEAVAAFFAEATNALQKARTAELGMEHELNAHPDRLHDDDGFRRN